MDAQESPVTDHLVLEEALRDTPPRVWRARLGETAAIVKFADDGAPWSDPRSAFFGGQGLVPPFCMPIAHEAAAWARVDPARVLGTGTRDDGVPWLALRAVDGDPVTPGGPAMVERCLREGAQLLAHLHGVGVVHRDLRPANLVDTPTGLALIDLDASLLDGLGVTAPVGSRRWRAPEQFFAAGDARSDLYALGRVARWANAGDPDDPLADHPRAALVARLTALDPAERPASVAQVLEALGAPVTQAPKHALHPAMHASPTTAAVEEALLTLEPWQIVTGVDAALFERWAVATIGGRLLAEAARTGGARWLLVGALCGLLAERTGGDVALLYAAQARECLARADAPWHPASAALRTTLDGADRQALVEAYCALERFSTARRVALGAPDLTALVDWHRGAHTTSLDTLRAGDETLLTGQLAASHLLVSRANRATAAWARLALPSALVLAAEACPIDEAQALSAALAQLDPARARPAQLILALRQRRIADAVHLARAAADAGAWSPRVAACVALLDDDAPDKATALAILGAELPVLDLARTLIGASLAATPNDPALARCLSAATLLVDDGPVTSLRMRLARQLLFRDTA